MNPSVPLDLELVRREINSVDDRLLELFLHRMELVQDVIAAKKAAGVPVNVPSREEAILARMAEKTPPVYQSSVRRFYQNLFSISRAFQAEHAYGVLTKRILLCGVKHSGKTAVGRTLAGIFGVPFFDTDEMMESEIGTSVRSFFQQYGETEFRIREAKLLRDLSDTLPELCVVSLGGGSLSNPFFNVAMIGEVGRVVWLRVPDEVAFRRMESEGLPPFLANAESPLDTFIRMNQPRLRYYSAAADFELKSDGTESVQENAQRIAMMVGVRPE